MDLFNLPTTEEASDELSAGKTPDSPPSPTAPQEDRMFDATPKPVRAALDSVKEIALTVFSVRFMADLFINRKRALVVLVALCVALGVLLAAFAGYAAWWFAPWRKKISTTASEAAIKKEGPKEKGDALDDLLAEAPASSAPWWSTIAKHAPLYSASKLRTMLSINGEFIRRTIAAVDRNLLPFDKRLHHPFLLVTMYAESSGDPRAYNKGHRGLWQVNARTVERWAKRTKGTVSQLEGSPEMQASLLNQYLAEDWKPMWDAARISLDAPQVKGIKGKLKYVSSPLTLVGRLFPGLPPKVDVVTASILWMNGTDPADRHSTVEHLVLALRRAVSMLLIASNMKDIQDVAALSKGTDVGALSSWEVERVAGDTTQAVIRSNAYA